MTERGVHSLREITTQGESWQDAFEATLAQREELTEIFKAPHRRVLFIGCGSTHYLARFAAPYLQRVTGRVCAAWPSSELCWQTESVVAPDERPVVVALSRSGRTSETILAADKLRQRGSPVITISCYGDTDLARLSTATVAIIAGQEESYAQTRSFAGMLVAVQTLAALLTENDTLLEELRALPAFADAVVDRAQPLARRLGEDKGYDRISYLGSGELFGLASEATVKMKEMSLTMAEPYRFMEFRHGPMALVNERHLVLGLVSDRMRGYEVEVLRDLKARGARLAAIANRGGEDLQGLVDPLMPLETELSELARPVLYLPMLQLMAYYRSMARGLNPDRPKNVVMAIELDGTEMRS